MVKITDNVKNHIYVVNMYINYTVVVYNYSLPFQVNTLLNLNIPDAGF